MNCRSVYALLRFAFDTLSACVFVGVALTLGFDAIATNVLQDKQLQKMAAVVLPVHWTEPTSRQQHHTELLQPDASSRPSRGAGHGESLEECLQFQPVCVPRSAASIASAAAVDCKAGSSVIPHGHEDGALDAFGSVERELQSLKAKWMH